MAHYTIKPRGEKATARPAVSDARSHLTAELTDHLAKTWRITIEKRVGSKWEPLEAAAEIDVHHAEETNVVAMDVDDSLEQRVNELVDVILEAVDSEARVDGPLRCRVQGWPERGRRELFTVGWTAGPQPLAGEIAIEKAEAGMATVNILLAVIEKLGRHHDRALTRAQQISDQSTANVTKVLEALGGVAIAQQQVAAPMVDLEKLRITERGENMRAQLDFEQEQNSMKMFMEAVGLIGKAYMAERRDKRREERERASHEPTIDVDAEPARAHAEPPPPRESWNEPSVDEAPSTALVVHGERFNDAEDLAMLLEDLEPKQRHELQRVMGTRMWGLVLSASEARDVASYDARFNDFYDAYTEQSPEDAARLFAQITGIIGLGAGVLAGLIQSFEKRTGVTVA